ncbi:MAG: L,D-transpeptidase family protein [Lachnospiraceae bacterium]
MDAKKDKDEIEVEEIKNTPAMPETPSDIEDLLEKLPTEDKEASTDHSNGSELDDFDELEIEYFDENDEHDENDQLDSNTSYEFEDFDDTEDFDDVADFDDFDQSDKDDISDSVKRIDNTNSVDTSAKPSMKEETKDTKSENEDHPFEITDIDSRFDQKESKFKKPLLIISGSIVGIVLLIYILGTVYFSSHFYLNTKINGKDYSTQTVAQVEKEMASHVSGYVLTLKENVGTTETINGTTISLDYKPNKELKQVMQKQNAFLWPKGFFQTSKLHATIAVDYNEEALVKVLNELECMQDANQTASSNAYPVYNEGTLSYDIVPEVYGTQLDKEVFTKEVKKAITEFKTELNLQEKACYLKPKFDASSPEVLAARDKMNTYVKSTVTYNVGEVPEVVSGALIASWITLGPNMEVGLNTEAITGYVASLNEKYSTVGSTRSITTPGGKAAQVSGGTFGWELDQEGELNTLIANIQSGTPITRDLIYAQTGAGHGANDWGGTYVEVDLSAQYMWYIVNGGVAFESAVVTGAPTPAKATPQGVYSILEKAPNSILKGEIQPNGKREYETKVAYWMRVTWSGIGFHDANWQPTFGGDRYMQPGGGSHGCINMPPSAAATFYGMLNVGDPVVMHY